MPPFCAWTECTQPATHRVAAPRYPELARLLCAEHRDVALARTEADTFTERAIATPLGGYCDYLGCTARATRIVSVPDLNLVDAHYCDLHEKLAIDRSADGTFASYAAPLPPTDFRAMLDAAIDAATSPSDGYVYAHHHGPAMLASDLRRVLGAALDRVLARPAVPIPKG